MSSEGPRSTRTSWRGRHHEILRQTVHRLREQLIQEGVPFTNEMLVDEACFAKNAMLSIGKTTPYKAVVGQAPNLLQDFEMPNTSMLEDPQHIHRARARELALGTIVEQTARMRVERTLKAKSRVSGQVRDFKNGDLVDVYRAPPNKDMDGWRGPAKIVDASPETLADGIVHVRWGGRVLIRKLQDVRKHIAFWSMFFLSFPSEWDAIQEFIKTLGHNILHVGWLFS